MNFIFRALILVIMITNILAQNKFLDKIICSKLPKCDKNQHFEQIICAQSGNGQPQLFSGECNLFLKSRLTNRNYNIVGNEKCFEVDMGFQAMSACVRSRDNKTATCYVLGVDLSLDELKKLEIST